MDNYFEQLKSELMATYSYLTIKIMFWAIETDEYVQY